MAVQEWQRCVAILDYFALIFPMMFVVVAKITSCVRVVWSGHKWSSVVKHKHSRVCHLWLSQILGFFFFFSLGYKTVSESVKRPQLLFQSRAPRLNTLIITDHDTTLMSHYLNVSVTCKEEANILHSAALSTCGLGKSLVTHKLLYFQEQGNRTWVPSKWSARDFLATN